jgi:putative ABC transport system permease protein
MLNVFYAEVLRSTPPIALDPTVIAAILLLSLLVAIVVGLLPVTRACRADLSNALHVNSHPTLSGGRVHWGNWMVSAQAGLALMLLIGSALLIRSFANAIAVEPGFAANRFLHVRVALSSSYQGSANVRAAKDRIMASIREISGVEAVTTMPGDVIKGLFGPAAFQLRASPAGGDGHVPTAWHLDVTPEFFDTLGIRIVEGRGFSEADMKGTRRVHVIDRTFAERYFPGRSAVGEGFEDHSPNPKPDQWPLIIGVAEVAKFTGLDARAPRPYVYQASSSASRVFSLILRTNRRTAELLPVIREQLRRIDPALPVYDVRRLDEVLDDLLDTRRGVTAMTGTFALIAVLLAALGVYGMLAYAVAQRTREIGIRMVIGATRRHIVSLILRQCVGNVGLGLILGLLASLALTRYLRSELFGVEPNDVTTFVASVSLLSIVAALASWYPARRAAGVDPVITLRAE